MSETLATVRASAEKLRRVAELCSGGYHDEFYLNVQGDRIESIFQTGGRKFMSHITFDSSFFSHLEGEAEAFLPLERYTDYLQQADPEGTVEMEFLGTVDEDSEHPRLADHWRAEGAMNVQIRLPGSRDDLEKVPWGLPGRFNDRNEFVSKETIDEHDGIPDDYDEQKVPPTRIETAATNVANKIVDKADFAGGGEADYYPVTVEESTLKLDLGRDEGDDAIWGEVDADVTGPDLANVYKNGFDDLFAVLEGDVTLATAPTPEDASDAPLIVTQSSQEFTARYVIGSYSKQ